MERASSDKAAGSNIAAEPAAPVESAQRIVIRNATLSIIVKDPSVSIEQIAKMADEMGGYVVTSNLSKYTTRTGVELPKANITIRVPAEKLTQAMDTIKSMVSNPATDILNENVSGQDVTKEYTDQKSRLTNLENAEKQLQKILEETTKTDEVLQVYNQLVAIREQIEVTKGQIKYYEESAALSSINISLDSQASVQPLEIGGWHPVGVARDALQTLIDILQFLGSASIWIVIVFVPLGLIGYAGVALLVLIIRKLFKSKPKAQKTTPPQA